MEHNDCGRSDDLLLFMEEMLDAEKIKEMEMHVSACKTCQEDLFFFKGLEKDFNSEIHLPSDFTIRVMGRICEKRSSVLSMIGLATIFTALYFILGLTSSIPFIGSVVSNVFLTLKNLNFSHLLIEGFKQNTGFLCAYTSLVLLFTVYFSIPWKKSVAKTKALMI